MLTPEIKDFSLGISQLDYSEADMAVALLWYLQHVEGEAEASSATLAKMLHDLSLRGRVNVSRLARYLRDHPHTMRGSAPDRFKIKLSSMPKVSTIHEAFLKTPKPKVAEHVVDRAEFASARKYLLAMIDQINGCYQFTFYDGCAVMCRRLMETLLIEAFEHKGHGDKIKAGGEYVGLGDIIARAQSGNYFKLQRGSAAVMEAIKEMGDTAAHSRTYITKQQDIDDQRFKFRKAISELAHLAGIS